jgi:thiamine transport system substrate-binding protein
MATIAEFGTDGWQPYWKSLRDNGVMVVDGWTQAYNIEFSGASGKGDRPIVVSYSSSPPAEVIFADPPVDAAPTAVASLTCFEQIEYAGILRGTKPHISKRPAAHPVCFSGAQWRCIARGFHQVCTATRKPFAT